MHGHGSCLKALKAFNNGYCCPPQVLDAKLPFDEKQLLLNNMDYLLRSLRLEGLSIYSSGDPSAASLAASTQVQISLAHPGNPIYAFSVKPGNEA